MRRVEDVDRLGSAGLETPTSHVGLLRLAAVAVGLAVALGIPWCQENVGSIDLMTGNRAWCRTVRDSGLVRQPPPERRPISSGSSESRPDQQADTAPSATRRFIQLRGSDERTSRICSSRRARTSRRGTSSTSGRSMPRRPTAIRPWRNCWREALTSTRAARAEKRRCTPRRAASASRRTSKHASSREAAPCGRRRCECARTRQRLHAAAMRDVVGKPQHGDGEPAPLARRRPRGAE